MPGILKWYTRIDLPDWPVKPSPSKDFVNHTCETCIWLRLCTVPLIFEKSIKTNNRKTLKANIKALGLDMTSRLIVPGQYDHHVYTESEAEAVYWRQYVAPQLPGPSSPAYGTPPTANRWSNWWGHTTLHGGSGPISKPPTHWGGFLSV